MQVAVAGLRKTHHISSHNLDKFGVDLSAEIYGFRDS